MTFLPSLFYRGWKITSAMGQWPYSRAANQENGNEVANHLLISVPKEELLIRQWSWARLPKTETGTSSDEAVGCIRIQNERDKQQGVASTDRLQMSLDWLLKAKIRLEIQAVWSTLSQKHRYSSSMSTLSQKHRCSPRKKTQILGRKLVFHSRLRVFSILFYIYVIELEI